MAEEKKAPRKTHAPEVSLFLFFLLFASLIWYQLQADLSYLGWASFQSLWARFVVYFITHILPIVKFFAWLVSGLAIVGIAYSVYKMSKIAAEEKAIYKPPHQDLAATEMPTPLKNERWDRVLQHINSNNSADWRLAIIEADVMLDDLLTTCGYHGDTIGEKLKAVEKSDFLTLESAWEAHKVRNQIAHAGGDFDLTDREAKRVISLFESVFREFEVI